MLGALITSIAFWIILDSLAGLATGQQSLSFPAGSYPGEDAASRRACRCPPMQLITIGAMLVVTIGVHLLMRHSRFGAAMRAVGWNGTAAALARRQPARGDRGDGVPRRRHIRARRRAGGHQHAATSRSASARACMLKGFAAVVVGGYDDVRGAAVAGVALGVLEVLSAQYLSTSLRDGITYALLLGLPAVAAARAVRPRRLRPRLMACRLSRISGRRIRARWLRRRERVLRAEHLRGAVHRRAEFRHRRLRGVRRLHRRATACWRPASTRCWRCRRRASPGRRWRMSSGCCSCGWKAIGWRWPAWR